MSTELKKANNDAAILEKVILQGDLAELSPKDRVDYYARVCTSLGLNPFTRPFDYIKLNSKLTLYARKDATDQLRSQRNVSITISSREVIDGIYVVTAQAKAGDRTDESTGAVDVSKLAGEFKANAMMKAETKAKRRVTLSIVGLGWLDETEVSDIPRSEVQTVDVDIKTGEIVASANTEATKKPSTTGTGHIAPPTTKQAFMTWVFKPEHKCRESMAQVAGWLGYSKPEDIPDNPKDILTAYQTTKELKGWTD